MKQLLITYNGSTLFDGQVDEFSMSDAGELISIQGRKVKPEVVRGTSTGASLLSALAAASKQRTENAIAEKKAAYEEEREPEEET